MKQLKLVHRLQVRNWSTNQMIMSLWGQTLSARRVHRPGGVLKLWFPCPDYPHRGLFFRAGPAMASLYKTAAGPLLSERGPQTHHYHWLPLTSLTTVLTARKTFSWSPPVVLIFNGNGNIQPFRIRGLKENWQKRKPKKKSPTHLFPFTVFPLASPIQIWLQRCSNWKAFVCRRSYCSLINCKLGDTRCLSHQWDKRDLNSLFKSCFAHFALVTLRLIAICWNLLCY